MRSPDLQQPGLFSYVSLDQRVPADHPIRRLRVLVDAVLQTMHERLGEGYATTGRPSIPPERLLRALLLQVVYSIRSERLLMEQVDYNLLFRWFVGLNIDEPVWDHSTFSFNRDRVLDAAMAQEFFGNTVLLAEVGKLTSDEHFSVDGSLLEAWASHKSVRPKDDDAGSSGGRNVSVDFHGDTRTNATHASTTDPDARLYRKGAGKPAQLCYMTNALTENRHGFMVGVEVRHASGTAEREGARSLAGSLKRGSTLGADKAYDTQDMVAALRQRGIAPHIARNTNGRRSAIVWNQRGRGYATSQRRRKLIEQSFGWAKTIGGLRKLRFVGLARVTAQAIWTFAAYNLIRIGGCGGWWRAAPT